MDALIFDIGSQNIRAGFAGDDYSRAHFPNVYGTHYTKSTMSGMNYKSFYVGDECQAKRGVLQVERPMHRSMVVNWDAMERILHHSFYNEIRVAPEEHYMLFCKNTFTPMHQDEKLCAMVMEKFDVPALTMANSSVLALSSTGSYSGVAVECGHGIVHAVPVYKGKAIQKASMRWDFGGYDLTQFFVSMLRNNGMQLNRSSDREVLNELKEKVAFTRPTSSAQIRTDEPLPTLLDGTELIIENSERSLIMEAMFDPSLYLKKPMDGIHLRISDMLNKLGEDPEMQKEIAQNIYISGGLSKSFNFTERIGHELKALHPQSRVRKADGGTMAAWCGASYFTNQFNKLLIPDTRWVTKQAYQEYGPNIVHKRIF